MGKNAYVNEGIKQRDYLRKGEYCSTMQLKSKVGRGLSFSDRES